MKGYMETSPYTIFPILLRLLVAPVMGRTWDIHGFAQFGSTKR
jgi:hypothetical protein